MEVRCSATTGPRAVRASVADGAAVNPTSVRLMRADRPPTRTSAWQRPSPGDVHVRRTAWVPAPYRRVLGHRVVRRLLEPAGR